MTELNPITSSHWKMLALLVGFAIAHSGLAALRPWGESKIGARSLPSIVRFSQYSLRRCTYHLFFQSSLRWTAIMAGSRSSWS